MTESPRGLVRVIGRWSLVALMLNTMIGGSIFGLPSVIAVYLGRLSPLAYFVAFAGIAVIAACLAEVASYFQEAGGPYLYARAAFGPFVGIQIGWLTWLSRISASAAVANLFTTYLSEFFPSVKASLPRATVLVLLIAFLAAINYRGVRNGNWLSNFFTITKLALLVLFVGGGLTALALHPSIRVVPAQVPATAANWFEAIILLVYAYGGFESALFVSGEARDPRKDAPIALLVALMTATLLYIAVQYVVIHTLANVGETTKPVVDSARQFLGLTGVSIVAVGTLVSTYGYLSANMLHTPRITYAMGERGDFPAFFARIHPRYRTPYLSIVAFSLLLVLFSVGANFRWNASLSAVSRLFIYGSVAAALPALRRKYPGAAVFRLSAGMLFVVLGLMFTALLVTRMHLTELVVVSITLVLGLMNWLWVRAQLS
jgi:basic amino acid/polyamine antiporter, APA family